jgi:Family of unknown function (DUF5719)
MSRARVGALLLALALGASGAASSLVTANSPAAPGPSADFAASAESTALYCTGLGTGPSAGRVVFTNLTSSSRTLAVSVASNTGGHEARNVALGAHASTSISPNTWVSGSFFGVGAIVSGGGVVGAEVAANASAVAPCSGSGVDEWYAAGFDTLVGSSATLSLFNPSATPAVVNVTTVTASGFSAPAPFQGLAVGPHAEVALNLGSQIVNTSNIGVHVSVLRGAVTVMGVQTSGATTSLNVGQVALATTAAFPLVTTAANARAQVRVSNPNDVATQVTVNVALSTYHIAPEVVEVPAFASGLVTITPNSAIPAAGFASLTLTSSEPVATALAVGAGTWSLSAPSPTSTTWLLSDFGGRGFSRAALTNDATSPASVIVRNVVTSTSASVTLGAGATSDLRALASTFVKIQGLTLLITSDRPIAVTTVLPINPVGPVVASALNGG